MYARRTNKGIQTPHQPLPHQLSFDSTKRRNHQQHITRYPRYKAPNPILKMTEGSNYDYLFKVCRSRVDVQSALLNMAPLTGCSYW